LHPFTTLNRSVSVPPQRIAPVGRQPAHLDNFLFISLYVRSLIDEAERRRRTQPGLSRI